MIKYIVPAVVSLILTACGGNKLHYTQEGVEPKPQPKINSDKFLELAWTYSTGKGFSASDNVLLPVVEGGTVYVAGLNGGVAALNLETGIANWQVELDTDLSAGIGAGDGLVVVAGPDGEVMALDRNDGALLWQAAAGGEVLARPLVAPGVVVIRAGDSRIIGLNTATGKLLWSLQKSVSGLSVRGASMPLLNGRGIVTGLADGRLIASDVDNGKVLWETPIGARRGTNEVKRLADIDADPALLGTVLYIASFQSRVVAMALGTPRVIWSADISTLRNFGLDADRLYITAESGVLHALNRYTGEVVWEQNRLAGRGLSAPLAVQGSLLVGDFKGIMYQLDSETGAFEADQSISGGAIVAPPIKTESSILILTEGGRLHAFKML